MSKYGVGIPCERSLEPLLAHIARLPQSLYRFPPALLGRFLEPCGIAVLKGNELLRELSRKAQGEFVESLGVVVRRTYRCHVLTIRYVARQES